MEISKRIDLYKLLPAKPVTVELGVAEGLFSNDILTLWRPSKHYMVDLWGHHPEYPGDAGFDSGWHKRNFDQASKIASKFKHARILRGPTAKMAQTIKDQSVDIVYIDACHSYECVTEDIKAWWPKIKPGGVIAFHDYRSIDYGVNPAVNKFAVHNHLTIHNIPENGPDAGAYIIKPK